MKEAYLAFIDLETSGLDFSKHEILEFGAIVTDFNLREIGRFCYKTAPKHIEMASPGALKVIGYDATWEKEAVPLERALKRLSQLVPKGKRAYAVGHNVKNFDLPFIKKAYKDLKVFDALSYHTIDTLDLAVLYKMISKADLKNLKLGTLVEHFGVTLNSAHSAMYDIQANLEVFKELAGYMKLGLESCESVT